VGASSPIYLLPKAAGTPVSSRAQEKRHYGRHWTAVHLDFVVDDIEAAVERATAAGASIEQPPQQHAYGRLALLADPFGNAFCLVQFTGRGYDEIARA
jgi:predicted enzyme related to lactoylglutathione lyase